MTAAQKRNIRAAANRGALLLDQFVPGWHKKVTDTIDVGDCSLCPLAQAMRSDYGIALNKLADILRRTVEGSGLHLTSYTVDSIYYGFDSIHYEEMSRAWQILVNDRRNGLTLHSVQRKSR